MCTIPMPAARPWNGACSDCKQFCAGHYLKPMEALQASTSTALSHPPYLAILQSSKAGVLKNESDIEDVARKVLLPKEEVSI